MTKLEIEREVDKSYDFNSELNIDDIILENESPPKVNKIEYPQEDDYNNDIEETPTPFTIPDSSHIPVANYNMFANSNNTKKNNNDVESISDNGYNGNGYNGNDNMSTKSESIKSERMSEDAMRKEKVYLLFKLKNYEKRGHDISIRVSMDVSLQDLRNEVARLQKKTEVEQSQQLLRSMTLAGCGFLEWANNKYDPLDADLDGWTESMQINIDNFDDVFEELHEKYGDRVNVPPEMKLIGMFGMSAFMFAWSKRQLKSQRELNNQNISNDISSAINNLQKMSGGASMPGPENIEDVLSKLNNMDVETSDSEKSDTSDTKQIKINTKRGRPKKS